MVKQFEVYWIDLDPTKGSEINKKRPCVVLSPNEMNNSLKTLIVAPLTSTIRNYPTRVNVTIGKKKGQVVLDQIRSIDKIRLSNKIEMLNKKTSDAVKDVLLQMFK